MKMDKLKEIIKLSRKFGSDPDYVIAGGGNSSFKDKTRMWVKASGTAMSHIDQDGFVCLDRLKMQNISKRIYSNLATKREEEVKQDLQNSIIYPSGKRPSVEASLHEIIPYNYVMHTHPVRVNGILCSANSKEVIEDIFGDEAIYIRYVDPGYLLFKEVKKSIRKYRMSYAKDVKIIFLENHGLFAAADSCNEIEDIYSYIDVSINKKADLVLPSEVDRKSDELQKIIKTVSGKNSHPRYYYKSDNSELAISFVKSAAAFKPVMAPFTPDNIVYCKSKYLFISVGDSPENEIERFRMENSYYPKVIAIEGKGLIATDEDIASANIVMDIFKSMMKVAGLSELFGGPHPLTEEETGFIDNWEVENYRRNISKEGARNIKIDPKL